MGAGPSEERAADDPFPIGRIGGKHRNDPKQYKSTIL